MEQVTTAGKWCRGEEWRLVGIREERFEIAAAGVGDQDRQFVDDFLARRANTRDHERDCGVEPQPGFEAFLGEQPATETVWVLSKPDGSAVPTQDATLTPERGASATFSAAITTPIVTP